MHTLDRQAEQLRMAGIADVPPPDLSWAAGDVTRFDLPPTFLLLVPGGSRAPAGQALAGGALRRSWPLCAARRGVTPVVLGGEAEAMLGAAILNAVPRRPRPHRPDRLRRHRRARPLARFTRVGNDTGPMHLIVACGLPRDRALFGGIRSGA